MIHPPELYPLIGHSVTLAFALSTFAPIKLFDPKILVSCPFTIVYVSSIAYWHLIDIVVTDREVRTKISDSNSVQLTFKKSLKW